MTTATQDMDWKSSMQSIRISKNEENETYSITVIDDKSHGYRVYTISDNDMASLKTVIENLE